MKNFHSLSIGQGADDILHDACRNNDIHAVRWLLQNGTGVVHEVDNLRKTPLHYAAESNSVECLELLLLRGADVNVHGDYNETPLHWAARSNSVDCVKLLLEHGADVNVRDDYNETPLQWAAKTNSVDCVKLLLELRADINVCCRYNNNTPLHWAAESNSVECVQLLILHGVDVNVGNCGNRTPLHWAASSNSVEVSELILQHGANIDLVDDDYDTVLSLAARYCHLEFIKTLLKYNANVNIKNSDGNTPLLEVAKQVGQNSEIDVTCLELLIQASGQFDLRDENGELIPDIARNKTISEMLLPYCVHPRSLKELCRYQIRSSLHHQFLPDVISSLNLPTTLQRFVLLQE